MYLIDYTTFINLAKLNANAERFKDIPITMGENVDGLSVRDAAEKALLAIEKLSNSLKSESTR